ncbi:MAG TPA: S6e family ribosomal protein [Candidatus Baltobacteraceae bacterium]|nr:S6e family ribosomal protein [Candidatus Baltobacteraceae bacterium]HVC58329.1 S6e family ribosomal protein [Candidatus Acidoferrales bacterium]
MKIVYSDPKTGKSGQMEVKEDADAFFLNRKLGEIIDGAAIGLSGYKFKISGGSDNSGFPMDRSIQGYLKARAMKTVPVSGRRKGIHTRATVRGNTISAETTQINLVVTEYGEKPLEYAEKKKE